ncbi:chromate transporter [Bacillus sp. FJAT-27251]|uniref:chromate transporter n=1 Tax=Bacillus sp. FJAT-27251 TaxID=1684142 RepID=UPI0006A7C323|nr:chromate transporter [Bacillus sp. FJAT-27251]
MKKQWKVLIQLFWTFFKIGPSTFGGGYAMIPLIEEEVVQKKKWLKSEEITDVFALSQSVPGAVAINSATFVGQRIGGIKGAIAAMLGISFPTFLIVLILGALYLFIYDNPKIEAAFLAIRASVVAIIVYAAIRTIKSAIIDKTTIVFMIAGVFALFYIHPLFAILLGAIAGIISRNMKRKLINKFGPEEKKENPNEDYKNNHDYYMGTGI